MQLVQLYTVSQKCVKTTSSMANKDCDPGLRHCSIAVVLMGCSGLTSGRRSSGCRGFIMVGQIGVQKKGRYSRLGWILCFHVLNSLSGSSCFGDRIVWAGCIFEVDYELFLVTTAYCNGNFLHSRNQLLKLIRRSCIIPSYHFMLVSKVQLLFRSGQCTRVDSEMALIKKSGSRGKLVIAVRWTKRRTSGR